MSCEVCLVPRECGPYFCQREHRAASRGCAYVRVFDEQPSPDEEKPHP